MMQRHWSGHVYYYAAALVGLGLLLGGSIGVLRSLAQAALPTAVPEFRYQIGAPQVAKPEGDASPSPTLSPQQRRTREGEVARRIRVEGFYGALTSAAFVLVGTPVFVWHIGRARRRDSDT